MTGDTERTIEGEREGEVIILKYHMHFCFGWNLGEDSIQWGVVGFNPSARFIPTPGTLGTVSGEFNFLYRK